MRKLVLSTALLAALAGPGLADNRSSGPAVYDRSTHTLWLNGDEAFAVPPGMGTTRLADATTVTVFWQPQGGDRVVTRYTVEERGSDGNS